MNPAIVISALDNVATALEALDPGTTISARGTTITVVEKIPAGHKVALTAIPAGAAVMKYGSEIGLASADIAPGAHVHVHNVASTRARGDLRAAAAPTADGDTTQRIIKSETRR